MTALLERLDDEPEFADELEDLAPLFTLYRINTPVIELDPAIWGNDQ